MMISSPKTRAKFPLMSIVLLLGLLCFTTAFSQAPEAGAANSPAGIPGGLGLYFGVHAPGVHGGLAKSINNHFGFAAPLNLRIGYSFMKADSLEIPFGGGGSIEATTTLNLRMDHIDFILDTHPFKGSFRLSLGAMYNTTAYSLDTKTTSSMSLANLTFSPEEIGSMNTKLSYNPVAPYVGLGFGNAAGHSRVCFMFDLGAYYSGPPKVTMEATGMIEPTAKNAPNLESVLADYWFFHMYPVVSMGLGIKIL